MAADYIDYVLGEVADGPDSADIVLQDKKLTKSIETRWPALYEMLFDDDLNLLEEFCRYGSSLHPTQVSASIMLFLYQIKRTEEFLARLISWKLAAASVLGIREVANVFRDNSMTVMMVMAFVQTEGSEFIRGTLVEPLRVILRDTEPIEVNPQIVTDDAVREANMTRLRSHCELLLRALDDAKQLLPATFRRLCAFTRSKIEEMQLGTDEGGLSVSFKVLSSVFFLRYILPVVANPDKHVPADTVILPAHRNTFKYVSKVLMNLCNGVEFGQKEPYMIPMNSFLQEHVGFPVRLLAYISEVTANDIRMVVRSRPSSSVSVEKASIYVTKYIQYALPRLELALQSIPEDRMQSFKIPVQQLEEAFEKLHVIVDLPKNASGIRAKLKALTVRGLSSMERLYDSSPKPSSSSSGSLSRLSMPAQSNVKRSTSTGILTEVLFPPAVSLGSAASTPVGSRNPSPVASPTQGVHALRAPELAEPTWFPTPPGSPSSRAAPFTPTPRASFDHSTFFSNLPTSSRDFTRQALLAFRGNMGQYLNRAALIGGRAFNDDAHALLTAYMSYLWEIICREAMRFSAKRDATSGVVSVDDIDRSIAMSIPSAFLAMSRETKDLPSFCFQTAEMVRDFSQFVRSSPQIMVELKIEGTLVLEEDAANLMANVLEHIINRVLSYAVRPADDSPDVFVSLDDVHIALGADKPLVLLANSLVNYEQAGRKVYNPLPDVVRTIVAQPDPSRVTADAGDARAAFYLKKGDPKKTYSSIPSSKSADDGLLMHTDF